MEEQNSTKELHFWPTLKHLLLDPAPASPYLLRCTLKEKDDRALPSPHPLLRQKNYSQMNFENIYVPPTADVDRMLTESDMQLARPPHHSLWLDDGVTTEA